MEPGEGLSLMFRVCGMIWVISAADAASECGESARLTVVEGSGRDEDVVGRIFKSGRVFADFPEDPI
jgi:hypothetical protein